MDPGWEGRGALFHLAVELQISVLASMSASHWWTRPLRCYFGNHERRNRVKHQGYPFFPSGSAAGRDPKLPWFL